VRNSDSAIRNRKSDDEKLHTKLNTVVTELRAVRAEHMELRTQVTGLTRRLDESENEQKRKQCSCDLLQSSNVGYIFVSMCARRACTTALQPPLRSAA
jgi:hypothetical protein